MDSFKQYIERLFKTLQDRLIKEMRLDNISTKEEANGFLERYLPKHNKKFGKPPLNMANLHIFSCETQENIKIRKMIFLHW
jgi:hypothetical protein